jgi:hypothetical protein
MAIVYDIFGGDDSGGPVDYTTVLATTSGLSASLPALAAGTRTRLAVRARDTVTGLSDRNTDAAVLVAVGADGSDQTGAPVPPIGLRAFAGPGGAYTVEWSWPYIAAQPPAGFRIYLGTPTPSYAGPAADVSYASSRTGRASHGVTLGGLSDGVAYRVAVRAYNATGEEQNTAAAAVTGRTAAPPNLTALTAALTY